MTAAVKTDGAGIGADGLPFSPYIISEWTSPAMNDRKSWTAYNADQMRAYRDAGAKAAFVAMSPDDREAFVKTLTDGICRHCWYDDPDGRCQCWNDA